MSAQDEGTQLGKWYPVALPMRVADANMPVESFKLFAFVP